MSDKHGTAKDEYMHESIEKDAVKYDLPPEEMIEALCQDNRALTAEVEVYKARLKAVEGLAACYRMQVRPSEKLFSQLDKTSKAIKALPETGGQ